VPKMLRFDVYEVDLLAGQIRKRGARIRLREKSFQVLAALLERPGEVVTREALQKRLWPDDVFVDFDNNLNTSIARLREALSDSADRPRFIETLPKHGYRFLASVSEVAPPAAAEATPTKRPRLLVLPFVNLSGDPGQEHFSNAVTDDLTTELASIAPKHLAVIARTTAMYYKNRSEQVTRISRELSVDYVVEGGVRRADDRIGINVQVIRASDQEHVFAKRYDADSSEVFGLQGRVARAIADHIGVSAGVEEIRLGAAGGDRATRKPTDDVVAYNEYVQGCYCFDHLIQSFDGFEKGMAHLEQAVARDPGFALPHEVLAQMYWLLGYFGVMAPRDAFAAGILHAVRALEIDNTRAESRALVAQYHKQLDYNWPDIERELARALELNPASSLVRLLYAVSWLMPRGRIGEAIAEIERALEWDPLSYHVHFWLAIMLVLAHEWDRGMDQARLLIDLDPAAPFGPWLLGVGLRGKGLLEEATAAHRRAVDLSGGSAMMLGWFGLVLASGGRTDEARGVLERLEAMARTRYVPPTSFAWVYLGLREVDRAFEWLDRAVDARDQFMMPIKSYAFFAPIRDDPRYHELVRRMNL
jgi:TolB-like protein